MRDGYTRELEECRAKLDHAEAKRQLESSRDLSRVSYTKRVVRHTVFFAFSCVRWRFTVRRRSIRSNSVSTRSASRTQVMRYVTFVWRIESLDVGFRHAETSQHADENGRRARGHNRAAESRKRQAHRDDRAEAAGSQPGGTTGKVLRTAARVL